MLECKVCIRKCLTNLVLGALRVSKSSGPPLHPFLSTAKLPFRPSRNYSTIAATALAESQNTSPLPIPLTAQHESNADQQIATPKLNERGRRQERRRLKYEQELKQSHIQHELRYLSDPLKLADRVLSLLRQDDQEKALEIVRLASKRVPCTVSWNHLLDFELSKGRVTFAMKVYNDMKKRAQIPDSYTYTLLLRGLAQYTGYQQSLPRALSIYHSMFAPNSPVKPSIIHTNAVLKVCARCGDMDTLWGIAAQLPSRGNGAPDNLTYTTILNAIRTDAWHWDGSKTLQTPEQTSERRQKAVINSHRLWRDIISRWRKGDLLMDEELVCAMGRVLLLGHHPQEWDDVLSLVEQTMGIKRLIPRIADPERRKVSPVPDYIYLNARKLQRINSNDILYSQTSGRPRHLHSDNVNTDVPDEEDLDGHGAIQTTTLSGISDMEISGSEFNPVDLKHVKSFSPQTRTVQIAAYAHPSRNTLSLLLDACIRMRANKAAQGYWGLLTRPNDGDPTKEGYNIFPDAENYHMYLRLLRVQRASREAAALAEEMAGSDQEVAAKTFRIAMSCCVRDKLNPNVQQHARKLMALMQARLVEPDLTVLDMYLQVAFGAINSKKAAGLGQKGWKLLLDALDLIEDSLKNLLSLVAYGRGEKALEAEMAEQSASQASEENPGSSRRDEAIARLASLETGSLEDCRGADRTIRQATRQKAKSKIMVKGIERQQLRDFVENLISGYDRVIFSAGEDMPHQERMRCKKRRSILAAYVTRSRNHPTTKPRGKTEPQGQPRTG